MKRSLRIVAVTVVAMSGWIGGGRWCPAAEGKTLVLTLPEKLAPKSAVALTREMKLESAGKIDPARHTVTFEKLLPDTPYDITLTLPDGTSLQGFATEWYGLDRSKAGTDPVGDDDRKEIEEIIKETKTFENKKRIMHLSGDAQRVTTLVELIRDEAFHASGDNIVWRVELWYFKNEYGGWVKVQQVSKVLRRERFKDKAGFNAMVPKIRWIPELGGLKVPKDKAELAVTLPDASVAGAAPTGTPKPK